ncbi:hypothetical protein JW930_06460 [Candidatus Woesearchaeota archaeon]|nr:hypothetical protein [Candidatus Woesearchaeota archaeon]
MRKRVGRENIILLILAIVLSLIIAETIFRVYYGLTDKVPGASEEEICTRTYFREISKNNSLWVSHPGGEEYLEYCNYSGIRPIANLTINKYFNLTLPNGTQAAGLLYDINTNSQHMLGLVDYKYEKDPNKLRIAVMGDSFTWGTKMPYMFTYGALLQEMIPNSEVLNFGISGIGIDTMYLRWKYEILTYEPDVFIMAIYIDDIARAVPCIYKPNFVREVDKLKILNLPPPTAGETLESYEEPKLESYFFKHIIYRIRSLSGIKRGAYQHGLELLDLMLDEVKQTSEKQGTNFLVLIIEAGNDHQNTETELWAISELKEMLISKKISFISSNEIFRKENFIATDYRNRSYFHFTPEGYGLIAQGIKNQLESEKIIEKQKNYYFQWIVDKHILALQNKENPKDLLLIVPYDILPAEEPS